ncbi:MAG: maltotransferase domain-containing protein, partial [Prolixibacteraceae bacterium]
MDGQQRVFIENIQPQINCGDFPVKRVIQDKINVSADIYCDSHDVLNAELLYKYQDEDDWQTVEMEHVVNDKWKADFILTAMGSYFYTVRGWVDHFKSWHRDILKKIDANVDYKVDLKVGAVLVQEVLDKIDDITEKDKNYLQKVEGKLTSGEAIAESSIEPILSGKLYKTMVKYPVKKHITKAGKELTVTVDRERANFSTWYEAFPRSLNPGSDKHGTFKDTITFLPYIEEMGFNVLYLPPIHPIG